MYSQPRAWHRLCERLASTIADYMLAQIEAGAQAIQIFDSWAGALNGADYREFAQPHTRAIFDRLAGAGVPLIHFGVGTTAILRDLAAAGGDVIGLDWRLPINEAWDIVGADRGVQGNLDPTLLLAPVDRLFAGADDVLRRVGGRPGHVFNLGHGVLPNTPLERVQELARYVHRVSASASRLAARCSGPQASPIALADLRRLSGRRRMIVIVGGGITGLAAAFELARRHVEFVLLESSPRLGGLIRTEHSDGFTIDAGPDSLLVQKPAAIQLCEELGLSGQLMATRTPRTAYVLRDGRLLSPALAFGARYPDVARRRSGDTTCSTGRRGCGWRSNRSFQRRRSRTNPWRRSSGVDSVRPPSA